MNTLLVALEITALGMGLVFAAILVLWGMMIVLTAVTADRQPPPGPSSPAPEPLAENLADQEGAAQAAAVAVAIAMAQQQVSRNTALPDPPTATVSAWQLGMRTRQMYQKGGSIRRHTG
jgi:Na+-transporting methylmalonyl-CoA/oxaloacetate decarboxylase gamma subunit